MALSELGLGVPEIILLLDQVTLLYGLILRILRDRSEADEVLQDVFVAVWNRAETYNVALGSPAARLVASRGTGD